MRALPHKTLDARAERRAMLALVAVFALLFQALVPSLASASAGAGAAPICRPLAPAGGANDPGAPSTPNPGQPCQHCVCPAIAAEPPPVLSLRRVAYVTADAAPAPPAARALRPPARAPPRPPGQGPPAPNV